MDFENNEQALIEAFHSNSPAAIDYIFRKYYQVLVVYAQGIVSHPEQAKDIAVDCFLKLIRKREDFKALPLIKSFLFITCKNASMDYLRYMSAEQNYRQHKYHNSVVGEGEEADIADTGSYDYHRMTAEVMHTIFEEIERLPKRTREIFMAIFFNKLPMATIAKQYDVHVNTVKNEKSRAITLLRTALLKNGLMDATIRISLVCFLGNHLF